MEHSVYKDPCKCGHERASHHHGTDNCLALACDDCKYFREPGKPDVVPEWAKPPYSPVPTQPPTDWGTLTWNPDPDPPPSTQPNGMP
jgi:hypothetical protein